MTIVNMPQEKKCMPIRVIIVEDSEDDAILLVHELKKGGYLPSFELVDSYESLLAALNRQTWDLVITDHRLPNFNSKAALETVLAHGEDIPVIVVSGSIRDSLAVEVMRRGAQDYIMKDNLAKLVPVVERELREKAIRSARLIAEDKIKYMSNHDSLTGLSNRTDFERRLQFALNSVRNNNLVHALLYIDLDQFKIINDTCGHAAGDEFLKQITRELKKMIRETDTLARLGGDEFAILVETCPLKRARRIAEELLYKIKSFRFNWEDNVFNISASIGLVMVSDAQRSYHDLLSAADMACYVAKDLGRNRIHVYSKDDISLIQKQGEMKYIAIVQHALENDCFFLYRQKIISLKDAVTQLPTYEVLLRLKEEDGSVTLPGVFIPAAERYNIMQTIDRWVIEKSISILKEEISQGRPALYFINLSGSSLNDDSIASFIADCIKRYQVPPKLLCFEITETAAITNLNSAMNLINIIRKEGCAFALDDFGAGLSSFSYLKTLNVDYLKIDGSFIVDILDDPMDVAIVESITKIGHVAGLKIIAEFVESRNICSKLTQMGIDYAQGYSIDTPSDIIY